MNMLRPVGMVYIGVKTLQYVDLIKSGYDFMKYIMTKYNKNISMYSDQELMEIYGNEYKINREFRRLVDNFEDKSIRLMRLNDIILTKIFQDERKE